MIFAWKVLLGSGLLWQVTEAQMVYKLKKLECDGNPSRVTNVSCHLKAINWNLALANLDCDLIVPMINPAVRLQILRKEYTNKFQPFLIDVNVSMCDVIEKRSYYPYGVMMWKMLKRFSNMNHTCPFSGHLSFRNGYLPTDLLPPFPYGFFQFRFTFSDSNSTNSEYLATVKYLFQVMEAIKSKKKMGA